MAKKSHIKVRMVPESNPDSKFIYYAKKPTKGEKAKDKLKLKKGDVLLRNCIKSTHKYSKPPHGRFTEASLVKKLDEMGISFGMDVDKYLKLEVQFKFMRHRKKGKKLGVNPSHRKSMLMNLANNLIEHGRIKTTDSRTKALRM